jgi:hypothetical protein
MLIFPYKGYTYYFISQDDIEARGLIYNCLSLLSSQYCEKEADLTVNGPADIEIVRYFNSNSAGNLSGWSFLPYTIFLVGTYEKLNIAYLGEHMGSILPYYKSNDYGYGEYKVNISDI